MLKESRKIQTGNWQHAHAGFRAVMLLENMLGDQMEDRMGDSAGDVTRPHTGNFGPP